MKHIKVKCAECSEREKLEAATSQELKVKLIESGWSLSPNGDLCPKCAGVDEPVPV